MVKGKDGEIGRCGDTDYGRRNCKEREKNLGIMFHHLTISLSHYFTV